MVVYNFCQFIKQNFHFVTISSTSHLVPLLPYKETVESAACLTVLLLAVWTSTKSGLQEQPLSMKSVPEKWIKSAIFSLSYTEGGEFDTFGPGKINH